MLADATVGWKPSVRLQTGECFKLMELMERRFSAAYTERMNAIDAGRPIDWGKTSIDYAQHRPGPPPSFYAKLAALGVGLGGQRVLDLGTGTGVVARELAQRGCLVAGVDVSAGQIRAARELAAAEGPAVDFRVAPAEAMPFGGGQFDVVMANQCWQYFDLARVIPELRRVLASGGMLIVSHFNYLARRDPIARASEALVLKFNPDWTGADWDGRVSAHPKWSRADFDQHAMFYYDEPIAFTRESWRGRMRALRGIGATLAAETVDAFDAAHDTLLQHIAPERFTVLHRIDAHLFMFCDETVAPS
jgi:SAM-dependent methyltransferase